MHDFFKCAIRNCGCPPQRDKRILISCFLLIFLFLFTYPVFAVTDISSCQDLSVAGEYYNLTQNVNSSSTCFNITANNITLDGNGYTVNYTTGPTAGYGVNVTSKNNITIKNLNIIQGNSSVPNAHAIYASSITNSNITNNTITASGYMSSSAYIYSSSLNTISDNTISSGTANAVNINAGGSNTFVNNIISTSGGDAYGVLIYLSNSNAFANNTVTTTAGLSYGIRIYGSYTNSIIGGSIISQTSNDYSLSSASNTNNFTNTNFTATRKISFEDATSWFNYQNNVSQNIWLKTNVSSATVLTRTLVTWSQSTMRWNDTNSTAGIVANYVLIELLANTRYEVYNTSAGIQSNPYILTSDSGGSLNFTVALNGNTEIKVQQPTPTVTLNSPINGFNQTSSTIDFNCTAYDNVNLTNVTLYNNLGGTWQANGTNSSGINNTAYIFTRTAPTNGTFTWNCLAYNNLSISSFASQNFTVTVDGAPPTSNFPANASYTQNLSATIGWTLYDNYAPGYYTVYRNGTIQNQSAWANNTNLNIWVNTSAQGVWNYTIAYNDSLGNNGIPNTVIINITGDITPPQYSLNSTNSTIAGSSVMHSLYWTDNIQLSGFIFSFDNGNGTFYNDSWVAFTGIGNWSNVTKTVNSTVGATIRWRVFANDTSNNWNESLNYSYVITNSPLTYSSVGTNSTLANQSTLFYAYWQDSAGLSGFIFSTNNSGEWVNYSSAFSGTGNWSNYILTLNATVGTTVGYRFYANDTNNQWNDAGIQTLTALSYSSVNASEDSYVNDTANITNFGSATQLDTRDNSQETERIFMKFSVPNYTYNNEAYLWVYVESASGGTSALNLYRTSYDWSENTITWSTNRPSVELENPNILDNITVNSSQLPRWYRFNISGAIISPGTYSFSLRSVYGWQHTVSSRESANKPYILLTPTAKVPDIVWNNKTSNDTLMFLVSQNESIQFNLTTSGIIQYNWTVNKVEQNNNASFFVFNVPECNHAQPSSCIWEIHASANSSSGSVIHREWVVSNLTATEAPDFIEYFADRDNRYRNGYIRDPWGRDSPYWAQTKNYLDNGYLTGSSSTEYLTLSRFNITYGTFKWRVRSPNASTTRSQLTVTGAPVPHYYNASEPMSPTNWNLGWDSYNEHDYFSINSGALTLKRNRTVFPAAGEPYQLYGGVIGGYIPISRRGVQQAPSGRVWTEFDWVNITVIHTKDHWWGLWVNDEFLPQTLANYDAFDNATSLLIASYSQLMMDNIEVYDDKYIYPDKGIRYGWYTPWWIHRQYNTGIYDPANATGIVIDGHNVTLKEIADAINNVSLFTYDVVTRTAVTSANISIKAGAELVINNETLLFNTTGGTLEVNMKNGAALNITDSTVGTVSSTPFVWNIASSASQTIWDEEGNRFSNATTMSPKNGPVSDFKGRFIAERSVINNSANLFLDGATEIVLNNTLITNIHSSDHGDYTLRGYGNTRGDNKIYQAMGNKSLWIVPRNDFSNFVFNNVTITSTEPNANLKIVGGEWMQNTTNIFNSDLRGVTVSTKRAVKYEYFIAYNNLTENSSVSLINSMFSNLSADTNHSKIMVKYYLDVLAKDASGNPVSGLNIAVRNENNDAYPPENIYEKRDYAQDCFTIGQGGAVDFGPQTGETNPQYYDCLDGGLYEKWYNGYSNTMTSTSSDGHTPRPSDKNRTVVLTDFVVTNDTEAQVQTNFTYNITAYDPSNIWTNVTQTIYSNGTIQQLQPLAQVTGITPDASWYRANPNTYQNTTNLTINYTRTNLTFAVTNATNITVSEYSSSKINFTATNATANQKMNITVSNSTFPVINGVQYRIKKDGIVQSTQAASSNQVAFTDINVGSEYIIESAGNNITVTLNSPSNSLFTNNATQTFNCSATTGNNLTNITLYTNASGWSAKNSTNITGTANSSQWVNTLADGSYAWNCLAYDNTGNSSFAQSNYTLTVDTIPPSTITNLQNQSQSDTWIYWNWTNPADFNHSEIYLNGTWKQNTSLSYYNATNLTQDTWYQLSIRTADAAGNINTTWVNSTAKTTADTAPPVITLVSPTNTTSLSAGTASTWINITTDENATCRYSTNASFEYADGTNFTNTGEVNHSFLYSGLSNSNTYALYYLCNDTYENINTQSVYHTFSVSSAATVTPTTPSGGGGGGGTTTTQNKTNQTTKNTTITIPTTQNTTNTTIVPQDEIKQKAQEKISEVSQKIKPEDLAAKQKLSEAEAAYNAGQYDKAYSLAVEAEGLIGRDVETQGADETEKKPAVLYYIFVVIVLAVISVYMYKRAQKRGLQVRNVMEEPIKPNDPKPPIKERESLKPITQASKSKDKDSDLDDIQKRLEEIRRKISK